MILLLLIAAAVLGCVPTRPGENPLTTTTTTTTLPPGTVTTTTTTTTTTSAPLTTTTLVSGVRCAGLSQFESPNSQFPSGNMNFTYSEDATGQHVLIGCSSPDPALELYAAIVANGVHFMDEGANSLVYGGAANSTCLNGAWYLSTEAPLRIDTIECVLTVYSGT